MAALISVGSPLGDALELGGDEGYELVKALLLFRGHGLFTEIGGDQPPLYSEVLKGVFLITGPSVLAARLVTVFFGAVLVVSMRQIALWSAGPACANLTVGFLLVSPHLLELGCSAMLEVPALALGAGATAVLVSAERPKRWSDRTPLAAGLLMGMALQTKLTAAIMLPAALGVILAQGMPNQGVSWTLRRHVARRFYLWFLLGASLAIACVWIGHPDESLDRLLFCHYSPLITSTAVELNPGMNLLSVVETHAAFVACGLLGLLLEVGQRRWRCVPLVSILLAAAVLHALHRPFWYYYFVHFVGPLAYGNACLLAEAGRVVGRALGLRHGGDRHWRIRAVLAVVVVSAQGSWVGGSINGIVAAFASSASIRGNPVIEALRDNRALMSWVFSTVPIYVFHSDVPVRVDLAVIPLKRSIREQLYGRRLAERVQEEQPEWIVLRHSECVSEFWKPVLEGYSCCAEDTRVAAFRAKRSPAEDESK